MNNQLETPTEIIQPERTIEAIELEIRHELQLAVFSFRRTAEHIAYVGGLLAEAKKDMKHGEWGPFVKRLGISRQTAATYMQIAAGKAELEGKCLNFGQMRLGQAMRLLTDGGDAEPEEDNDEDDDQPRTVPVEVIPPTPQPSQSIPVASRPGSELDRLEADPDDDGATGIEEETEPQEANPESTRPERRQMDLDERYGALVGHLRVFVSACLARERMELVNRLEMELEAMRILAEGKS